MLQLIVLLVLQADDFQFGPLDQRAHALFQMGTSSFVPDMPTNLKQNEFYIHASMRSINVLNVMDNPTYAVDVEFERFSLNTWYAMTDKLAIGVELPFETISGGFQDDLIAGFHQTFGLGLGAREQFPRNGLGVSVSGKPTEIHSSSGLSDIVLRGSYKILEVDGLGWSIGCQLKLPTAAKNDLYDSDGVGVGVTTNVFYQTDDWYFNAGLSFAKVGNETIIGYKLKPYSESCFLMVEYRILDWLSVVMQSILQSGSVDNFGEYSKWSYELDGGFKIQLDKHIMLDVGVFENIITYSNSADFGMFTGITFKY